MKTWSVRVLIEIEIAPSHVEHEWWRDRCVAATRDDAQRLVEDSALPPGVKRGEAWVYWMRNGSRGIGHVVGSLATEMR